MHNGIGNLAINNIRTMPISSKSFDYTIANGLRISSSLQRKQLRTLYWRVDVVLVATFLFKIHLFAQAKSRAKNATCLASKTGGILLSIPFQTKRCWALLAL